MLQNAYFPAKIGADTAENEQHFAEILPIGRHFRRRRLARQGVARHDRRAAHRRLVPERERPAEERQPACVFKTFFLAFILAVG